MPEAAQAILAERNGFVSFERKEIFTVYNNAETMRGPDSPHGYALSYSRFRRRRETVSFGAPVCPTFLQNGEPNANGTGNPAKG